jgi:hypothetical protein
MIDQLIDPGRIRSFLVEIFFPIHIRKSHSRSMSRKLGASRPSVTRANPPQRLIHDLVFGVSPIIGGQSADEAAPVGEFDAPGAQAAEHFSFDLTCSDRRIGGRHGHDAYGSRFRAIRRKQGSASERSEHPTSRPQIQGLSDTQPLQAMLRAVFRPRRARRRGGRNRCGRW